MAFMQQSGNKNQQAQNPAPPFSVLIVAGGSGTRLGGPVPKQYQTIGGQSILRHTIEKFRACPSCQAIRVVIHPDHRAWYAESVAGLDLAEPALAGKERFESVYNGLESISNLNNEDIILIHDAARPFVTREEIEETARAVQAHQAASLAAPVSDTLRHQDGHYVDRQGLWAMQTPQGFRYGLIMQAHKQADPAAGYTDDTAMVAALGTAVQMVRGGRHNFKITTAEDMAMAQEIMRAQNSYETRIGSGFDVHAFDEPRDGTLVRLCGVDIPHSAPLKGHSDADVGLHALTDALLGAVGGGDIGQHFPPSDAQWRGVDSAVFVEKSVDMIGKSGGQIVNIDLTIICEKPKIGPQREAMRARVAEICGIDPSRVNIKGTTTEKLGFTGRGEGIAAQAAVSVSSSSCHSERSEESQPINKQEILR